MVAKTVASRKGKARRLQDFVAEELNDLVAEEFNGMKLFHPAIMGESGVDIKMDMLVKTVFPWDIECKNAENWSIPSWWKQTTANTREGRKPLLVIKKNYMSKLNGKDEPLVIMRWSDFKELI